MLKMETLFQVEDFAKCNEGVLAAESFRSAAGSKGAQAFQSADNPKMVIVITEWDNLKKAKAFSQFPALRKAQNKSGVLTKPEVYELKLIWAIGIFGNLSNF